MHTYFDYLFLKSNEITCGLRNKIFNSHMYRYVVMNKLLCDLERKCIKWIDKSTISYPVHPYSGTPWTWVSPWHPLVVCPRRRWCTTKLRLSMTQDLKTLGDRCRGSFRHCLTSDGCCKKPTGMRYGHGVLGQLPPGWFPTRTTPH